MPNGAFAFSLVVDVSGWETFAGFGNILNTAAFYEFAPGTEIFGVDYNGITFTTANGSWGSELVLLVNDSLGNVFLDWSADTTEEAGTFGPLSGSWNGPSCGPGPDTEGGPFSLSGDGILWVTVYESINDGGAAIDATIASGTLTIYTSAAPIPGPATYGLMGLGLLGVAVSARRSKAA